jgi:DNA-binding NarL/FixJ family response regulator
MRVGKLSELRSKIAVIGTAQSTVRKLASRLRDVGYKSVVERNLSQAAVDGNIAPEIVIFLPQTPRESRTLLARELRESNPSTKIVMLYDDNISGTEFADAVINANCEIEDLIRVLVYLTNKGATDKVQKA